MDNLKTTCDIEARDWTAQAGAQTEMLSRSEFEVLAGGARGGGKSEAGLAWLAEPEYLYKPLYKALVVRKNSNDLVDWVSRARIFFRHLGEITGNPPVVNLHKGGCIRTGHMKDENAYEKYVGQEYQKILIEELTQIPREEDYLKLLSSCRSTSPGLKPQVFATTNPGQAGHLWVKQRWVDVARSKVYTDPISGRTRTFVPARLEDNPILMKADPSYGAYLDSLPEKLRRAWKDGDWDIFEGQFFETWNRDIHVVPIPTGLQNEIIGIDYGYSNPASVGWYKIGVDGKLVRYKELYVTKETYSSLGKLIFNMTEDPEKVEYAVGDPAMWGDRAHHKDSLIGESGAETLQKELGNITLMKGDNVRNTGWGRCREYLKPYKDQHGNTTALFGVTENCFNFLRTFPAMIHDQKKPEDMDTNAEDHVSDELRYIVMSRPEKPLAEEESHILTRDELFWKSAREQTKKHLNREAEVIGMVG